MSLDRDIRKYAVPVRGTIWGMNYNDRSERDVGAIDSIPLALSDYHDFFPGFDVRNPSTVINPQIGARQVCPIRILKPHYGGLAECYVDLKITVASADSDLTLKLAIGRMNVADYSRVMNYTDDEINGSWRKIRGSDTPLSVSSGAITVDLADILNALPEYGSSDYIDDAFVLILAFNKIPTLTGSFKFNYLNIHTSVTGVV
jgi:hypothetical protein